METTYMLIIAIVAFTVPVSGLVGRDERNEEVESPFKALGETPTCPEGPPTYELPQLMFNKYCDQGSLNCELGHQQIAYRQTYFYYGIIHCKDLSYLIIVQSHHRTWNYLQRHILETVTVGTPFPTDRQILNSVFPVYSGNRHVVIYYKMEDKSCYRVTYNLLDTPKIIYDEVMDENNASDTCKAVKTALFEFVRKDRNDNWHLTHVCPTLEKEREKIDVNEMSTLKRILFFS